uniref:Uncharacterized protein n=1 Tax=Glossina brevipalpis TaxID=37001 RepID=A0A1A9WBL1_9MUSC
MTNSACYVAQTSLILTLINQSVLNLIIVAQPLAKLYLKEKEIFLEHHFLIFCLKAELLFSNLRNDNSVRLEWVLMIRLQLNTSFRLWIIKICITFPYLILNAKWKRDSFLLTKITNFCKSYILSAPRLGLASSDQSDNPMSWLTLETGGWKPAAIVVVSLLDNDDGVSLRKVMRMGNSCFCQ